jgi:short-subunit dehydrogenase
MPVSIVEKRIFEDISNDFEINVFGTLNIYKALYSKIKENGSIITINSILAFMNLPIMAQYCASKSALHSITQAIRAELKSKSIEVFEVFPGPMDTEMSKNLQMDKATPLQVVLNTFDGLTNKDFEIFPDDYSKNIISMVKNNSKKFRTTICLFYTTIKKE